MRAVVRSAKARGVPIRIGVNVGSLPKDLDPELTIPQQMVEAALRHIRILESLDFDLIKVSLKAFDVPTTIEAYREIADKIPYPLHIGITEAGTPRQGVIRSAVGIGILLNEGLRRYHPGVADRPSPRRSVCRLRNPEKPPSAGARAFIWSAAPPAAAPRWM